jgi:hypothetical protein
MSVFSVKISQRQHARLQQAPVPRALAAVGIQRFGVADAVRFAVISYLARPANPLPSAIQSGDIWLQVNLPLYLHVQLEERAAVEHRSKASLVRDAIDLYLPPAQGEVVAGDHEVWICQDWAGCSTRYKANQVSAPKAAAVIDSGAPALAGGV